MEPNNCPKQECGLPESTHRSSAGKRLSICGNGHSWDQDEAAAQKRKAEAVKGREESLTDLVVYADGSVRRRTG